MKALTDRKCVIEPKGKERFEAEDTAACVFLSNHWNPVRLENSDRRYVVTDMGSKYVGDRAYWKKLNDEVISDQRVCNAYFTKLMQRDVEKWNRHDIPKTRRRMKLKENNWENHFIHYLVEVVQGTTEAWGQWYHEVKLKPSGKKQCYFSKAVVYEFYCRYCKAKGIKVMAPEARIHELMWVDENDRQPRSSPKLRVVKVHQRNANGKTKLGEPATKCLLIDKEEVRNCYRHVLNEPTWDFPTDEDIPTEDIQDQNVEVVTFIK